MKKIICSSIALMMVCLLMYQNVSASSITGQGGSESTPVKGSYAAQLEETVYCVDVTWGSMNFSYDAGTVQQVWNPEEHIYEEVTTAGAGWVFEQGANVVTVSNRSNQAIVATVVATIDQAYSSIKASVTGGTIELANAATGATDLVAGIASTGSASITLSGVLNDKDANNAVIGTVTVTIRDKEND